MSGTLSVGEAARLLRQPGRPATAESAAPAELQTATPLRAAYERFDALRRGLSLRWLIGGCYAAVLAVTLLALGLISYTQVDWYLWSAGESRLRFQVESKWNRQAATRFPPGTSRLPALSGFPSWAPDLARESSTADVLVRVLLPDGTIVGAAGGGVDEPGVDLTRVAAVRAALDAGRRADGSYLAKEGSRRWQVLQVPLFEGTRYLGIVQAVGSLDASDQLLAALARYLVLGGALALLVGLAAGAATGIVLAGPLERLADTARRVAAGDLRARTGLAPGTNEVYAVAGAFDEMAQRLETTFSAQRRFIADASHELKTPLTAIGGMAEMLRTGVDEGEPAKRSRAVRTIEREVDRMSALVGDLLVLSRAEQRRQEERRPVELASVIGEVAQYARQTAPKHVTRINIGIPACALGDWEQLTRAIRNLVDNAIKYTPAGGTIALSCRTESGWCEVEVSDTGAGIPAADLPHVFDRFYRADKSRTRKTGGSGLGLAIVRSIVEGHGGSVAVQSQVGRGTTFTIRLPAYFAGDSDL